MRIILILIRFKNGTNSNTDDQDQEQECQLPSSQQVHSERATDEWETHSKKQRSTNSPKVTSNAVNNNTRSSSVVSSSTDVSQSVSPQSDSPVQQKSQPANEDTLTDQPDIFETPKHHVNVNSRLIFESENNIGADVPSDNLLVDFSDPVEVKPTQSKTEPGQNSADMIIFDSIFSNDTG